MPSTLLDLIKRQFGLHIEAGEFYQPDDTVLISTTPMDIYEGVDRGGPLPSRSLDFDHGIKRTDPDVIRLNTDVEAIMSARSSTYANMLPAVFCAT